MSGVLQAGISRVYHDVTKSLKGNVKNYVWTKISADAPFVAIYIRQLW